jgi:hypothetical protein
MITTSTSILVAIIVALITAVVGHIIVNWVKMKMEKSPSNTPMYEALETSTLIDIQLEDMIDELGCDRVWIAQFHNGGHFYPTGRSIQKFSVFYEKTSPNTQSLQTTFQNIPVSLFPKALSKIYKNSELVVFDSSLDEETYGVEPFTTQFDTKSICMISLHSLDNHVIGILGISFKDAHHMEINEWIHIRQKAGVIGTLLSEYLYQTNKK